MSISPGSNPGSPPCRTVQLPLGHLDIRKHYLGRIRIPNVLTINMIQSCFSMFTEKQYKKCAKQQIFDNEHFPRIEPRISSLQDCVAPTRSLGHQKTLFRPYKDTKCTHNKHDSVMLQHVHRKTIHFLHACSKKEVLML